MPDNLKDILSHLSTEIDQETLLKYLEGRLSDEQKHDLEKRMIDSEFANDAVEGLQQIKDKRNINSLVEQLNRDLHKKLDKKKKRAEKLKFKDQPWMYVAIVIILLLIIVSYFVLQRMLKP